LTPDPPAKGDRIWADEATYERYVGRWSRLVAAEFVSWFGAPTGARWLDVACGTGAMTAAILSGASPQHVDAIDRSERQLAGARALSDPRVTLALGDARELGGEDGRYDAVVAGLAFPAVADPAAVLREFARVVRADGLIGVYVWDFDGEMQPLRLFWEAATEMKPDADESDDDGSFGICTPDGLRAAFESAGLSNVCVGPLDVTAQFVDFDDYWAPFLTGDAPAQEHVQSLPSEARAELRELLRARLPIAEDGSFELRVRAWAGKGTKPTQA
jgi:SAM-dependent methyltransferase